MKPKNHFGILFLLKIQVNLDQTANIMPCKIQIPPFYDFCKFLNLFPCVPSQKENLASSLFSKNMCTHNFRNVISSLGITDIMGRNQTMYLTAFCCVSGSSPLLYVWLQAKACTPSMSPCQCPQCLVSGILFNLRTLFII